MDLNNGDAGDAGTVNDLLGPGSEAGAGGAGDAAGGGGEAGAGGGDQGGGGDGGQADGESADAAWLETFSAETGEGESASLRDWVKSTGVKDASALAKIARDNQRALRDSGRVKVPGEGASAEEIASYHKAIGVPEDPKGYTVPEIKGADGNPVALNTPFVDRVIGAAHKHGIPKTAMDALLAEEVAAQVAEHDAAVAALTKAAGDHVKSWGADKDARLAQVNAAAKEAGLSRQDMEYLRGMPSGPGKMLDMLAKFGTNFSEDALIGGERKQFGVNAAEAQKELDAIKADPELVRKARIPGSAENQRWNRLQKAAAAGVAKQTGDN